MELVCGTPASFVPAVAADAARTALATTRTPALGAGVKNCPSSVLGRQIMKNLHEMVG